MSQFMGTHQNRLDAKGRVSVPAAFRSTLRALNGDGGASIVLRPSHQHACIEAWPARVFDSLAETLQPLDLFSSGHELQAAALYADACAVEADKEGRIVLPTEFAAHAGLKDQVVFLGLGKYFHIWEPEAGRRFVAEARQRGRAGAKAAAESGAR